MTNRRIRTIASVVGLSLVLLFLFLRFNPVIKDVLERRWTSRRLSAALSAGETRSIEGRFSDAQVYRPLGDGTTRGDGASHLDLALLTTASQLQKAASETPDATTNHAWGVVQILLGQYDQGVNNLELAVDEAPTSAEIRNDLAVAYLERARNLGRFEDLPRALAASQRASDLDPKLLAARFTRAIAAQSLGLSTVSGQFWETYIREDGNTGWRDEAGRRLDQAKAQSTPAPDAARFQACVDRHDLAGLTALASTFPHRSRAFAEDHLLPQWATAVMEGRSDEAARLLDTARSISRTSPQPDAALVEAVAGLSLLPPGAARARMAHAYNAFGVARQQYEATLFAEAAGTFDKALPLFPDATHPFALWSRFYVAVGAYYRGDYRTVRVDTMAIERVAFERGYFVIGARAAWMQGLAAYLQSDFADALSDLNRSADAFARLGDDENLAAVRSILANVYLYVGSKSEVWRNNIAALTGSRGDPLLRRRHTQLMAAAHEATVSGLADASLVLLDEALTLDKAWAEPAALAESHNYRARSLVSLRRFDEAKADVATAQWHLQRVVDAGVKSRLQAEISQTEIDVLVESEPLHGKEAADRAIAFFASTNAALRLPRLLLARGRAWQNLGAHDRAANDFAAAADKFEAERTKLPRSQAVRLSHVDELWQAYPRLVDASESLGRSCSELLGVAERGRAFNLREARGVQTKETRALPLLEADEMIVYYVSLPTRLLILSLYRGGCDAITAPVTSQQLERLASTWLRERSTANEPRAGGALFDAILRPAWPRLQMMRRLGIVADGPLHAIPFAALPLGDGRRLIQQMDLRVLPTLALLSRAARPLGPPALGGSTAVVVAAGVAPEDSLAPLPLAAMEAATVRTLLTERGASVSTGSDGTLLGQLALTSVFHFAGHAIANPDFPLMSRLVLARPGERWLTAEAISQAHIEQLQLVVLSACDTDRGRIFGGDGPATLARAFLAAGARQVVGTLWPVQDRSAVRLITGFYEHWLKSGDAPSALRHAMLDGMTPGNLDWAAWQTITAY